MSSFFNLSFLFPFFTKKSVVAENKNTNNTNIPVSNISIVPPKETTLTCVKNDTNDSKYIETNNTPVYIVESSNDSHLITSNGTFIDCRDVLYVRFDKIYENRFFGGRTKYFPVVILRCLSWTGDDGFCSYKIGNREFYDLLECDKFANKVNQQINVAKQRK